MSEPKKFHDNKIDLILTIVLSVSLIATAWCAYQSSVWSGIQTFAIKEANSYSQQFMLKTLQQGQYSTVDVITFTEYIDALYQNDSERSEFYYQRLRADFKPAVDAWLEKDPIENPNAPIHPFVMPEYQKSFSEEAEQFITKSAKKTEEALIANSNSDNYVLLTVIYSILLFLGGVQNKIRISGNKFLFIACLIVFAIATINMFSLPIAT